MTEMTNNKIQILDDGRRKSEDGRWKHEVVPKASLRGKWEDRSRKTEDGSTKLKDPMTND